MHTKSYIYETNTTTRKCLANGWDIKRLDVMKIKQPMQRWAPNLQHDQRITRDTPACAAVPTATGVLRTHANKLRSGGAQLDGAVLNYD
ncbi:unnamed protein product [Colias eurytheme]|nr:unnamed protein product [Colias eurytheme]